MIFKFQQGGGALPPLVSYTPVTVTGGQTTAAKTSDSEKADLTDKDLLEMMGDLDGLPSDMTKLVSELQSFYIDSKYGSFNTSNITSKYLQTLNKMKIANFNKKEYDAAYKKVSENGGINELAISERGLLFCMNKEGDFKLLSIDDLKDNLDYQALTNSELLYYRAHSTDLANKNDILKVVKNGVGMEYVTKLIKDSMGSLGTTQNSEEGFAKTRSGELIQGLEGFILAVKQASLELGFNGTVDDLYKFKYLTKQQSDLAEAAITYIYNTLPQNVKTLLKTKTHDGSDKSAKLLVLTLVASLIDTTREFALDLKAGPTAKSVLKSSSKDSDELNTSLPLNILKAIGGYDQIMLIDRGDGIQMHVNGTYYLQIKDPLGKPIVNTSLETMLAESGLLSIIKDSKNITFGDLKISNELLSKITYNNTGIMRANLPINPDGSVRLDILENYEKLEAELELLGENASVELIKELYEEYGLSDLLNSDGTINKRKFAPFMITEGYTTEKNGITDSDFVYKVKDPTDQLIDLIKRSLTVGTGNDKEIPNIDTFSWYNPFDWFGVEDIYKAAIYIPINNNVNSAVYGSNLDLDYDEATLLEIKYRNFNRASKMNSTSADLL